MSCAQTEHPAAGQDGLRLERGLKGEKNWSFAFAAPNGWLELSFDCFTTRHG